MDMGNPEQSEEPLAEHAVTAEQSMESDIITINDAIVSARASLYGDLFLAFIALFAAVYIYKTSFEVDVPHILVVDNNPAAFSVCLVSIIAVFCFLYLAISEFKITVRGHSVLKSISKTTVLCSKLT